MKKPNQVRWIKKQGRNSTAVIRSNLPPKEPKKRKWTRKVSKKKFVRALKGTGGLVSEIARRLGVGMAVVYDILKRPGWETEQQAYKQEEDRMIDVGVRVIYDGMRDPDPAVRTSNARWFLSRKARHLGYGEKVAIEGGDRPIAIAAVPVESLDLPLEVRRQILEAVERRPLPAPSSNGGGDDNSEGIVEGE